ncbi:MAG: RNA polymerase sigma factor [Caldicoprobacterales bacterium]|jgi:RNA polymerase sigma factor (sigma-70 family)|nr:RNA polymerase sigma factor [Clostridiales bacterium]
MLLFTFVYEDNPGESRNNRIEIDEGLFKRIAGDDMTALDDLYGITERTMYAYTLSLTKEHQQALDLMQETYVKVISAAHLYKPMGKPLAWMFTIARNLYYTKVRKDKRRILVEPQEVSDDVKFSYVTDLDDRIVLEGVLALLSEEEREIVLLYAVSGMKHKEIAESLGLKLSTTLSKYHRALKKLRDYLIGREARA